MTEQPNTPEPDGLWLTITELAERAGIGKAAISERVARLERDGRLTTRPGKGKAKLVNAAEFDRAVGQVADLARTQGAATRRMAAAEPPPAPSAIEAGDPVYTREQARNMAYAADLKRLELEERRGQLVRADKLGDALRIIAGEIGTRLDGIALWADDISAEVGRGGPQAARVFLKTQARELRNSIADDIAKGIPAASKEDTPHNEA